MDGAPAEDPTSISSVSESAYRLVSSLWPDWAGRSLLAYAALADEPNLDRFLDRFLRGGGIVYLPVVTRVGEPLAFGRIDSMGSLEPRGRWGIREPSPQLTPAQLMSAEVGLDLIFVPALGFGVEGERLGNGGGFYDRTFGPRGAVPLESLPTESPAAHRPLVHGVCFSEELGLSGLDAAPWDLRIPSALTERGIHEFSTS